MSMKEWAKKEVEFSIEEIETNTIIDKDLGGYVE